MARGMASGMAAEIRKHDMKLAMFSKSLQEAILALPDNPRIRREEGNPHCFVGSFKDLGGNWSVEHHDFKKQYEMLAEDLSRSTDSLATIRRVITDGAIKRKNQHGVKLHPDVRAHLIDLWKEIWRPEGWKSRKETEAPVAH